MTEPVSAPTPAERREEAGDAATILSFLYTTCTGPEGHIIQAGERLAAAVRDLADENERLRASRDDWAQKRSDEISLDLAALVAERDALREQVERQAIALTGLLAHCIGWHGSSCLCDGEDCARDLARAALAEETQP